MFDRDLADVYRVLLLHYLTLLTRAARLLVLSAHAHTFDRDHLRSRKYGQYLAGLAFVIAATDYYRIAFFNVESIHMVD